MSNTHENIDEDEMDQFVVKFTDKGEAYFIKKDSKEQNKNAAEEYLHESVHCWNRDFALGQKLGFGIYLYFDFLKALIIANTIMMVFQVVAYLFDFFNRCNGDYRWDIARNGKQLTFSLILSRYNVFLYSSEYKPGLNRLLWQIANMLCVIVALAVGPIYMIRVLRLENKWRKVSGKSAKLKDDIPQNKEYKRTWVLRRVISGTITAIAIILQALITFGITYAQNEILKVKIPLGNGTSTQIIITIASIAIGITISITNILWKKIAVQLNQFEYHKTWASFRKWYIGKLILFKVFQLAAIGNVKWIVFLDTTCPLDIYGNQYFFILIIDLLVWNTLEILIPLLKRVCGNCKCCKKKVYNRDEDLKPEFDTGEEYLELIYRQYVLYNAIFAFPLASVISFVSSIAEYVLDRIRLTSIARRPKPTKPTKSSILMLSLILLVIALISFLNPGGGFFYLTFGRYFTLDSNPKTQYQFLRGSLFNNCPLFNSTNSEYFAPGSNETLYFIGCR